MRIQWIPSEDDDSHEDNVSFSGPIHLLGHTYGIGFHDHIVSFDLYFVTSVVQLERRWPIMFLYYIYKANSKSSELCNNKVLKI